MKNHKIAIVFDLTHTIELDYCGGLDRAGLYELEGFIERGLEAKYFSGSFIGKHPKTKSFDSQWFYNLPKLIDKPFVRRYLKPLNVLMNALFFYALNRETDVFIFLNPHLLTLLNPQKCLVQLQMPFDVNFSRFKYVFKFFEKRFMKSHYLFCSEAMRTEYSKKYPWMRQCSSILYNGVDTEVFKPLKEKAVNQKKKFVFAANWNRQKGLDVLLNAISRLEQKRDDFEVFLGGSANLWKKAGILSKHSRFLKRAEAHIKRLKTVQVIGRVNHDKLPSVFASMDLFLCPSVFNDPFPLVNLEAMACGLPVIGTNAGGIPEAVEHGKTGLIVERANPEKLAEAMECFLNNPEQIEIMGSAARKRVVEKFSWDHHIETLLKIIDRRQM